MIRAALIALLALDATAARIDSVTVSYAAGNYTVAAVLEIDAPAAAIRAALTDYNHLGRLSPSIVESSMVRQTDRGPVVYTRSRACAGLFCRQLRKTELVSVNDSQITALVLQQESNIESGVTRWQFTATPTGTRVTMDIEIKPAFFVPPLIGPPLVKSALKREAESLAMGLERAAHAIAYPPSTPP